ncbi:MAG TPA: RsmB/NOP family class I SAM-dependent RNA methyltransferase [Opitutaceae bacterium]|nr:RsmB/NOP family class I SAM-dependent RNA methyltransferase [Opitutaceae bacterium]
MGETLENHAARVLGSIRPGVPADAALREYLAGNRSLGAVGRRSVSRAVFSYFRWLRWLEPGQSAQRRVVGALDRQARFERDPSAVKAEALAARAVPAWLAAEMDLTAGYLRQLQREPPLWIRTKVGATAGVARSLGACEVPVLPAALAAPAGLAALRYRGPADLHRAPGFQSGAFEIQDLSSQLVGHACAPQPGETWWDACAGEGGKALHLSDLMRNKGLILATDRSLRRLSVLRRRAARAGAFNYRAQAWAGTGPAPFGTRCDGVLVDAPCSGVGTWQRNPHARWTTSAEDVQELAAVQAALLARAAPTVKPGGRLIYSVCSLTRSETTAVADGFERAHPGFEPAPLAIAAGAGGFRVTLLPQDIDANGMFIAAWRRLR